MGGHTTKNKTHNINLHKLRLFSKKNLGKYPKINN